ncbi:hypothetical protein CERSUDRAFT_110072 [Gelatoporia subvermispora B]|uniref:Uncharacterized protein n=1 Tax=Ceriporiopsis subvermispora (strain B) TaxID=914234 RepID=M2RRL0_CERS8|nr:hypothetical protein CERSUDRAFT_110072 [Gelatoporia subvermispora B]
MMRAKTKYRTPEICLQVRQSAARLHSPRCSYPLKPTSVIVIFVIVPFVVVLLILLPFRIVLIIIIARLLAPLILFLLLKIIPHLIPHLLPPQLPHLHLSIVLIVLVIIIRFLSPSVNDPLGLRVRGSPYRDRCSVPILSASVCADASTSSSCKTSAVSCVPSSFERCRRQLRA